MRTETEKAFQAGLLADAAYVTFDAQGYLDGSNWSDPAVYDQLRSDALGGTHDPDDVPFGAVQGGRGWSNLQFEEFSSRYLVAYHQPDQENGFSATLFYDTVDEKYIVSFRGTNTLFPDVSPSDLLVALGLSSLDPEEQHSSIASFFENAGLVDINGVAKPEYAGKVDFVGHSLGGYLSLWAMYEFRDLFAEVFTFNGAGISAIPGTPDYEYINALVRDNPLSPVQLDRIHNLFAEEGPELVANEFTFFRPGDRQGVFVERRDAAGSAFFHSVELLVESLAVYSIFALIDHEAKPQDIKNTLYAMSNESIGSLELTVRALSDLLGEGYNFSSLHDTADFRQAISLSLGENESLGKTIELISGKDAIALASSAAEDSAVGRGYRYALAELLPFTVTSNLAGTSVDSDAYDLEYVSEQYLTDRSWMLATLLQMNVADASHGELLQKVKFTDLASGAADHLVFDGDSNGYPATELDSPGLYDTLRARYIFGSDSGDEASSFISSGNDDHLYGMGGDDIINGLDGSDYIEGGHGNDQLIGGAKSDQLLGGTGNDVLTGGSGNDLLVGGIGTDRFYWNAGDGDDVIGDYDDAGDRVLVDGLDLSGLRFAKVTSDSPYFVDASRPGISLHYDGGFLTINAGIGPDSGSITVKQYSPVTGADFGIVLNDYPAPPPAITDMEVSRIGSSDLLSANETRVDAYDRQLFTQRGLDWSTISIGFYASDVGNYSGGDLHGTLGGVFEGGPQGDYLVGDGGSNALHGLAGDDGLEGMGGDDFLEGGAGYDILSGGDGSDLLFGSARAGLSSELNPGSSYGQFHLPQISDAPGDVNVLAGEGGDDGVTGGEHTDFIDGGAGADYLLGGTGGDYIGGGTGRDVIYGDSALHYGYFELEPGISAERLEIAFAMGVDSVGYYADVIHAGEGDDTVWGELGDDELYGEEGADKLIGDRYNDAAYFSAEIPAYRHTSPGLGNNFHGNDRLFGGAGDDLLLGLGGDDLLVGGADTDTLSGGEGNDIYSFHAGDGLDYIDDSQGSHKLLFSDIAPSELQVLFQGGQVFIGKGYGAEGMYLVASEWANVEIAMQTADGLIERSRLDTLYFDSAGNLLLTVPGTNTLPEADRDALFTVDTSDPDRPRIVIGEGVQEVEIEAYSGGINGATMHINSGGLQFIIELAAAQIATGLDFLSLADNVLMALVGFSGDVFGLDGDDHIVGSAGADTIHGGGGNDLIEGRGGDDYLLGEFGDDALFGGDGDDVLEDDYRGGSDYLNGGRGNDILIGGDGHDTYAFSAGDGQDLLVDQIGPIFFEFDDTVSPVSPVLYLTDASDSWFRFEYGGGDTFTSEGTTSSHWINGITVGGVGIPLVQRSDILDGTFRDTRWYDVFEPGDGSDTIYQVGWSGGDAFRFFAGDGADTIVIEHSFYPEYVGEIRFAPGVDLDSLSFSFANGATTISYGEGDQLTLAPEILFSFRDNVLIRFALVSEANPDWVPLIRSEEYGGTLYGTARADHIVGSEYVETIIPGFGADTIEAGDGPDRIVLNDVYADWLVGIGHKEVWGEGGNDIVETPLHQGLTMHYDRDGGHDTIVYDWSYSTAHPYSISLDLEQNLVLYEARGEDILAFGEGINLADLDFLRLGSALRISLGDGTGSIRLDNFFHAYDLDPSVWTGHVSEFAGLEQGLPEDILLHPAFLAAMPTTPVSTLRFADGTTYDVGVVLAALLEVSEATILGTEGDDQLYGTSGDDIIQALGGDDHISDFGGNDVIMGGGGNDYILLGSDSVIDPGPGDDNMTLPFGNHVIQFGWGSDLDASYFDVGAVTVQVQVAAGITLDNLIFSLAETDWGSAPLVSLGSGSDSLLLIGTAFDEFGQATTAPDSAAMSIRLADGTVKTGPEIYELALAAEGDAIFGTAASEVLTGTPGNDLIIGGQGNDTMDGGGGDDLFLVEGRRQGRDHIIGGTGFDTISGGDDDDLIGLTGLLSMDSIERIDGLAGSNTIAGTGANNVFYFGATELVNVSGIEGRGGRDQITGSKGEDVIIGGGGNDTLSGGAGNDRYIFTAGDDRDVINNADADPDSIDSLYMVDMDHDQLWLSRKSQHLLVNIAGSTDRVVVKNWYTDEAAQLDEIYAGDHLLLRDEVDQLVSAMAAFDAPVGVGATIPEPVRQQLEPVLASVWQLAS